VTKDHLIKKITKLNPLPINFEWWNWEKNQFKKKRLKTKENNNQKNEDQIWYKNKIIGHLLIFDKSKQNLKRGDRKEGGKEIKGSWSLTVAPTLTCTTSP